jgi:uncharacterized protein (DUF1697 family)
MVALLRAINLGSHNRVSMPDLRAQLDDLGYEDVATVVQSGNIVLTSPSKPAELSRDLRALLAERFDVDTPVVVRTAAQLRKAIKDNPLPEAEGDLKLFQVVFCEDKVPAEIARGIESADIGDERVAVRGREVYAWHVNGIQNSPLAKLLVDKRLRTIGTARNWNTVLKLRDLV